MRLLHVFYKKFHDLGHGWNLDSKISGVLECSFHRDELVFTGTAHEQYGLRESKELTTVDKSKGASIVYSR